MPDNNRYDRYNYNRDPDRQRNRPRQSNNRQQTRKQQPQQENPAAISSTIKGIIAIMITFLIVIIVIMVFAKSLFIKGNESSPKKTGVVTSTEYIPPETQTATAKETTQKTRKPKTEEEEEDEDDEEDDESSQTITCTGPVYLHPEPSSKSENLLTIPQGAEVKFFRNENNWYYVEYDGKEGYAWGDYFTTPAE